MSKRNHQSAPLPRRLSGDVLLLTAIGLVALAARLSGIGDRSLWYDELQSVTHAIQPVSDLVRSVEVFDPHPPLYYLQLHFWMGLFGDDEGWIRLNSVVWSLLTLPPLFLLGRRLFGARGGLLAAWFFALAPLSVTYAQDVRMYPMQMCLAVTSLYLLERLIADSPRPLPLAAFFLSLVASVYGQGAGFLLLICAGTYAILRLGPALFTRRYRGVLITGVIAGLAALPWLASARGTSLDHLLAPTSAEVGADLFALIFGSSAGLQDGTAQIVAGLALLAVGGMVTLPRTRLLILSYVFLPLLLILVLSFLVRPIWYIRLISVFLPMGLLAVAGVLMAASDALGRKGSLLQVFVAVCAFGLLPQSLVVSREERLSERFQELSDYLLDATGANDVIAFENVRDSWGLAWYSADRRALRPLARGQLIKLRSGARLLYRPHETASEQITVRILRQGNPEIRPDSPNFDRLFVVRNTSDGESL